MLTYERIVPTTQPASEATTTHLQGSGRFPCLGTVSPWLGAWFASQSARYMMSTDKPMEGFLLAQQGVVSVQ